MPFRIADLTMYIHISRHILNYLSEMDEIIKDLYDMPEDVPSIRIYAYSRGRARLICYAILRF